MTDTENKALYIADQLQKAGTTMAGAAGVLINFECESALSPTNVEDRYHNDTGKTDADYTSLVDNNQMYDFETDNGHHYGYGLGQWTLASRKKTMRAYHRARGVSIGDFRTQVDFFIEECKKDFPTVWNILFTINDPATCAWQICRWFENPANAAGKANYRASIVGKWYNFLQANEGNSGTIPDTPQDPSGSSKPGNVNPPGKLEPRTIDREHCTGWPEIHLMQAALLCRGYNVVDNGIFDKAAEDKLVQFQTASGLDPDGVCGPLTWKALLRLPENF